MRLGSWLQRRSAIILICSLFFFFYLFYFLRDFNLETCYELTGVAVTVTQKHKSSCMKKRTTQSKRGSIRTNTNPHLLLFCQFLQVISEQLCCCFGVFLIQLLKRSIGSLVGNAIEYFSQHRTRNHCNYKKESVFWNGTATTALMWLKTRRKARVRMLK